MARTKTQTAPAAVVEVPADPLGPVLAATESKLAALDRVPKGWTLLPGGVKRQIGVNRDALYGDEGEEPWLVTPGGHDQGHAAVRVLGPSESQVTKAKGGCGPSYSVRLVTTAPVLIKNR